MQLKELINTFKDGNNTEFEVRFGSYSKKGFKPELSKEDFETLVSFFEEFKLKTEKIKYTQAIFTDGLRKRVYNTDTEECCYKKRLFVIDDIEMGCRFAVSSENNFDEKNKKNKNILSNSSKNRTSFFLEPNFRLDLTVTNNEIYDIELECINKTNSTEEIINDIIKHTTFIMKFLNKTNVLCGMKEQSHVVSNFERLRVKFNNCKNIKRGDIHPGLLFTEKIDGERNYLVTDDNGESYLINNTKKTRKAGINFGKKMAGIVFDTECVYTIKTGLIIHIFDIIMMGRKYLDKPLSARINIINELIGCGNDKLKIKKYFNDKNDLVTLVEKNKCNNTLDGIIFSSNQSSYKDTNHLKWKPQQTVDLKVIETGLFAYDKNGLDCKIDYIANLPANVNDGDVLEFEVNKTGNLSFLRFRKDKTRGNYIECVYDIINDAKNNISDNELINLYNEASITNDIRIKKIHVVKSKKTEALEFRKFHNYIKKQLYTEYLTENDRLVELACGKGGDLHKWNCSYVLGVDINKKFLENAKSRNETIGRNCDFKYLDISKEVLSNEYPELINNKFDVCAIQFAIHYLFETRMTFENLIKNINCSLKSGGYFIGTCMDEKTMCETDNDLFSLEFGKQDNDTFGNDVIVNFNDISASSDGILRGDNREFIVKNLKSVVEEYGFTLVEMKNFKEYLGGYKAKFSKEEKLFSSMNTTFVFIKN